MGMPGALGAGAWGVQTTRGVLPSGGLQNAEPELGLRALFLTLECLGRWIPGWAWRRAAGPSDLHLHFPGRSVPDALVWNLSPDATGPSDCGRESRIPSLPKAVESYDLSGHTGTW